MPALVAASTSLVLRQNKDVDGGKSLNKSGHDERWIST
jgi:hypothetical protein